MSFRPLLRAFVTLALILVPLAPCGAGERFTQATDVLAVEVPVQVLKDGRPVRGLTAADFELYEGKKLQTLTGFETLDLQAQAAAAAPAARALPPSGRRRFLLFFDLGFSQQSRLARAQEAARKLLAGSFHPSDLIGVAAYTPSKGPRLLLGFTPDRLAVEAAIANLGFTERARYAFDPLDISTLSGGGPSAGGVGRARERREAQAGEGGEGGEGGGEATEGDTAGAGDVTGDGLRSFATLIDEGNRSGRRQDVDAFLLSVESFAKVLAAVQGRKQVVLLSEGFDSSLLLGTSDDVEMVDQSEDAARGRLWEVSSEKRFGNTRSADRLEKMLEALRRSDCVVQAVDIGGVRETGGKAGTTLGSGEDGLFAMANGTGGELYRNFNDLSLALGRLLERTSITYVLAFQPEVARDGNYHKIRVELKNRDLGKVVYRAGYYAPLPYAQQKPLEKLLLTAGAVVSGREGGALKVAVLAAPFALSAEKAYVPVLIEIEGASLVGAAKEGTLPAEVYVYALDSAGKVQDYFTQTLGLDLAKVGEAVRAGGIKFFGDLELPPGSYGLRVLVRNGETGASGLRGLSLEVPAFAAGKPVLLPAFFPAPTQPWLMARETKAHQGDIPFPFMAQGKAYLPASLPVLKAGQESAMAVVGYRLAEGETRGRATVLAADGREAGEGGLRLLAREAGVGGLVRFNAAFRPPSKLAPGDYVLLLTLTGPGGESETSATPFVVASGG